ncbi:MAG: hypothetical protein BroJett003_09510 [Planctomycetota bacterium]|nr:MAG: hypothetical protein BroJett003_09510 [Planctomycetota bacterium]
MRKQGLTLGLLIISPVVALGEIPRPDAILFGQVYVDGEPAGIDSGLGVVVRAEGLTEPLAAYRLGDVPATGTRYVLHVAQAFAADGTTPSASFAASGQSVRLYVQPTGGVEVFAAEATLPSSGQATQVDLRVSSSALEDGRTAGRGLSQGCGAGGGLCGALGFSNFAMMLAGLGLLRSRRVFRKGC